MTKVVTAVAILQLRDAGKFALDDRVSSLLDEWHDGAARPATVFDLLTHSAGLSYGFKNGDVAKQYRERGLELPHRITPHGDRDNSRFPTSSSLKEFCATLSRLPRALEPGREFSYSASFDVLGRIVEATSGTDLESYFREHIFEPLGMRDTSFVLSNDKQDRLAAFTPARRRA
ncbi:hypothetical protein CTAYLR_007664 [Chrysophaeum taylorii]|uniref:Beta-lactamase-related domain-containing protein n=1 Tax=Chrysophaeum taylorii TaxID=2483200 RepID=A0AAD7U855_9STRA|nr:hypothetical protein CTAYLR_007664 [Chrysophaeum taylorii]